MAEQDLRINVSTASILKIVAVVLSLIFLYFIRDILLLIFISIILAALIEPPVNWAEERRVPRGISIIVIYVVLVLFLGLVVRLVIPPIIQQVALLAQNFPSLWSRIVENTDSLRQFSEEQGLSGNIQRLLESLQTGLQRAATGVYGFTVALFRNLVNFVMVLVLTYYLVVQKDSVSRLFRAVTPARYHEYLIGMFHAIQEKIGDWARGQLILGLIIGALSFVGLMFLLPEYALVLALIAAITELIPYLGPILGAIPAVFLGFTVTPYSWSRGLAVLILYAAIQQLENNVIVPKVMKKQLGLNPVVIIIAMLIGERMAGIIGLILALPVATSIGVIAKDFLQRSKLPDLKARLDRDDEKESSVDNT